MDPIIANLTYWSNGDFSRVFQFTDGNGVAINFTGSTFKMDLKLTPGGSALSPAPTLDVTNIATGQIGIAWSKAASSGPAIGVYFYDLVKVTAGKQEIIMTGTVTILQGITL